MNSGPSCAICLGKAKLRLCKLIITISVTLFFVPSLRFVVVELQTVSYEFALTGHHFPSIGRIAR